jgi:hypothetical protein
MQLGKLSPDRLLEWYTARALEAKGYRVRPKTLEELGNVRIPSGDRERQIDVHAIKQELFRTENLLVECKCYTEKIPVQQAETFSTAVDQIRGRLDGSVQGLFCVNIRVVGFCSRTPYQEGNRSN